MRCVVMGVTAALLSTAALSGAGMAQQVTSEAEMRSGPSDEFPVVTRVSPNEGVQIHGCVEGHSWCDVSRQDNRGWLPADQLQYPFGDRLVRVSEYGGRLDLPVVGFAFSAYWDTFYSGQPFYEDRERWQEMWRDQPNYLDYGPAERSYVPGGSLAEGEGSAKEGDEFGASARRGARRALERSGEAGVESRSNLEAGRGQGSPAGPDVSRGTTVNEPAGSGEIRGSVEGSPVATTPGSRAGPGTGPITGSTIRGPTPGNSSSGGPIGGGGSGAGGSIGGGAGAGGAASGSSSGGGGGGGGGGG